MTVMAPPPSSSTSPPSRRGLALAAVCLAAGTMPLTFTGIAVVMGDLAQRFQASPLAQDWVTNAFMLCFGSSQMLAGTLADLLGRRRVFFAGLLLFMGASLAILVSPGIVVLNLLRGVQGLAGAAIFAGGAAALAQEFEGRAQTRAFSLLGASFGIGLSLGPIAAGWLGRLYGWRSIFVLGLTLVVVAALLAWRSLRETRDPQARRLDGAGALSFTLALTALTAALVQAPQSGWGHPFVLGGLLASVLLFALFGRVELRQPRPMLELSLFRYPRFVGVQLLAAAPAYAYVVLLILLPLRFMGIEGLDAMAAGQAMGLLSAPLVLLPLAAGWMTRWFSAATLCGTGLLVSAGGLLWLSQAGGATAALAPLFLIGLGISLPWGLMDGLAVSVVPRERAGMATGIFSTTRVAGEGLALALVSALLTGLIQHRLGLLGAPAAQLGAAAHQLSVGGLEQASQLLPQLPRAVLAQAYQHAFSTLSLVLAGITTLTALMVFMCLGRVAPFKPVSSSAPSTRQTRAA